VLLSRLLGKRILVSRLEAKCRDINIPSLFDHRACHAVVRGLSRCCHHPGRVGRSARPETRNISSAIDALNYTMIHG